MQLSSLLPQFASRPLTIAVRALAVVGVITVPVSIGVLIKRTDFSSGAVASASASSSSAEPSEGIAPSAENATALAEPSNTMPEGPILGAIAGQLNVFVSPNAESRRLGYIRLGSVVKRDPEPVSKTGCPGGWYRVYPKGYACAGEEATTDPENIVLKAGAIVRPNPKTAMPYRYGFVRATLPLYLKPPSAKEQFASEMSLKEHLETWRKQGDELNKVILGSYDVPVDGRGVPLVTKKVGELNHPTTEWTQAELFGGKTENDPIPFWLDGGRKIPNLADFKVPEYAVFADRARRHTGLAFAGSFQMGPEGLDRRFGITTDMRLAPTSKVKPDTGSPWHGLELVDPAKSPPLPFAWVRTSGARAYKFGDDSPRPKGELEKRSIVLLTGRKKKGPDGFYWEMKNGLWMRQSEAGVVRQPDEWPEAAKGGKKWLEVSIENQTLTMWEGQKPVYATLVSTGQDGMKDPKTTKSTVMGNFSVKSKHITATMDSNERSGQSGGKRPEVSSAREGKDDDEPRSRKSKDKGDKPEKGDKGERSSSKAKSSKGDPEAAKSLAQKNIEKGRDPAYGVTKRRGEGTFWLRDVPYVQFFEKAYALHVAYWHDVFGIARSHGCINLSPIDGRWIFQWTDPPVPDGWHGVLAGAEIGEGTPVLVHP